MSISFFHRSAKVSALTGNRHPSSLSRPNSRHRNSHKPPDRYFAHQPQATLSYPAWPTCISSHHSLTYPTQPDHGLLYPTIPSIILQRPTLSYSIIAFPYSIAYPILPGNKILNCRVWEWTKLTFCTAIKRAMAVPFHILPCPTSVIV